VARSIAQWPPKLVRNDIVKLLLDLLKETAPPKEEGAKEEGGKENNAAKGKKDVSVEERRRCEMRIAIIDALRLTGINEEQVVEPLLEVAKTDPAEGAWRAAAVALRRLGSGKLILPAEEASDKERQELIKTWEAWWRHQRKRARRTAPKREE
jgi:HEAT repeat protein